VDAGEEDISNRVGDISLGKESNIIKDEESTAHLLLLSNIPSSLLILLLVVWRYWRTDSFLEARYRWPFEREIMKVEGEEEADEEVEIGIRTSPTLWP